MSSAVAEVLTPGAVRADDVEGDATVAHVNALLRSGTDQLDRDEGIEVVDLSAYLDALTVRALAR